jgi:hypothetical protein
MHQLEMPFLRICAFFCSVICFATTVISQEPPDSPDPVRAALLSARSQAEMLISQGEFIQAGNGLLASLRALPPDRSELADPAHGNLQLAVFMMEYLMPESTLTEFVTSHAKADEFVTDKLVLAVYDMFIGQASEGNMAAARALTYLTTNENQVVRAIALYVVTDPYFFDNQEFTEQHIALLSTDYPDLELTQVALSLLVQEYRKTNSMVGLELLQKYDTLDKSTASRWSASFRERVRQVQSDAFIKDTRHDSLDPLREGAMSAPDWQERFSCLLMLEDQRKGGHGENVRPIAASLAENKIVTPEVLRSRIILARLNSKDLLSPDRKSANSLDDAYQWAQVLLDTKVDILTPERTLWEDRMKAIKGTAKDLREAGYPEQAKELYAALAQEFPNSLVAQECQTAIAAIDGLKAQ